MNTHVHSSSAAVSGFQLNPWTLWLMLQVAFIVGIIMVTLLATPQDMQSERERLDIEHTIEERTLWQQLNARQCNLADESVQTLQQQLSAYNNNGRSQVQANIDQLKLKLNEAQAMVDYAVLQGYPNGMIVREEITKVNLYKKKIAEQRWEDQSFSYDLIADPDMRNYAVQCASNDGLLSQARSALDDANTQHAQTQRQRTVIYLFACLSYILLAMGSLAFQQRRNRIS
jgi:tellurite resistance protein